MRIYWRGHNWAMWSERMPCRAWGCWAPCPLRPSAWWAPPCGNCVTISHPRKEQQQPRRPPFWGLMSINLLVGRLWKNCSYPAKIRRCCLAQYGCALAAAIRLDLLAYSGCSELANHLRQGTSVKLLPGVALVFLYYNFPMEYLPKLSTTSSSGSPVFTIFPINWIHLSDSHNFTVV